MAGSVAPVLHEEPSRQGEHSADEARPMALLKEPAKHGSGSEAPVSQKEPGVQLEHAVPPSEAWYLPAPHLTQEPCPPSGCTVPGLHSVGARAPVEHEDPAGQEVHWPLLPRPGVLLNVPCKHGSAADAPAAQKEPGEHSTQAVPPAPS